jgi:pentatricopeptide repeat protein
MEKRDVITWNVMIGGLAEHGFGGDAYDLFIRMQQDGFKPDVYTCVSILNACASAGALEWVKEVHNHAREAGFESNLRVGSALVHMYAECGSMDDARLVFDRMEERDVFIWNVMIGGLAEHGFGGDAYDLFIRMQQEGFKPDVYTYVSILNACASVGALEWVKEVHNKAREAGFESNLRVGSALVRLYAKCGSMDDARPVFDRMEERDVITWNVMIGGLAEHGFGDDAYDLFIRMQQEGFKPDVYTYVSILNACASAGALEWVKEVHNQAREAGFELDLRVGSALVRLYAKCGSMDDARPVFDRMEERDVITWNVMIGGLAQHGCGSEALDVFRRMIGTGVKPDGYSFVALLSACSHAGLVDEGRRLFLGMSHDYGISPSVVHWSCMVDILGRAGHLEDARLLIDSMAVEPGVSAWGALLGACRSYGNVEFGELAAKERVKLEPEDASTFVLLSNIYAAAAKWEEVSLVRTMIQERGVRKEPGRSWIEVDNKIHAFVVGDTSHPETKEIYAELSRLTEKIKAEGYLPDTRLVLRDVDEKDKELSLCSHSERLAIAYGLIRTPSSAPVRVYKNLRVCSDCHTATKLISKVTRKEIVVRDANRFHHFKDGLCSCKDYW